MGVSSPQATEQGEEGAKAPQTQAAELRNAGAELLTEEEAKNRVERAEIASQQQKKQAQDSAEQKKQGQEAAETEMMEPEPEQELEKQTQVQTPERDEEISVISSDVSPHDSDFDFLQVNTDTGFSLLTPSPHRRSFTGSVDAELGPLASPPLSRGSSAACSPSRFFKSPLVTSAGTKSRDKRTVKTPQRRTIVPIRLATPKRLLEAIDSLSQQEEKALTPITEEGGASTGTQDLPPTLQLVKKGVTSMTPPRTPSPPSKQQMFSRRLKDVFDRSDDEERETMRGALKSPALAGKKAYLVDTSSSLLASDDIQCVPSGLMTSPSEHDSFFSFANSLSPLMPAEEFDNSFMSVRLSPLVSLSSYELPRLLPPFPEPEQNGDKAKSPAIGVHDGTPTILKTPKNSKARSSRGLSSAGSLAGGGISAPGSASVLSSPGFFSESFPNIQASTSATPGKDERSKLGGHSVMKMKLHTSFGASPSSLDSHPTREIQAINNSLYVC
ncbi:unnamed protein product [Phytophthora lilii]|uniref:Unnamed protein product n=1 Tax=Phytophthora lilii TaxID=2077276 RepID=A0A9W6TJW0_9STRA|nr:unnamed protein product [Phytophthora lilii]